MLLGTTFYFGGNMANVHADATPAAAGNNDATQQQTNVNSAETNQAVTLKAGTQTSAAGNSSAPASQSSTPAPQSAAAQTTNVASSTGNNSATPASASVASNALQAGQNNVNSSAQSAAPNSANASQTNAPASNAINTTNSDALKAEQMFTLGDEQNADITVVADGQTILNPAAQDPAKADNHYRHYKYITAVDLSKSLPKAIKVTYTNLQNSSYNGVKIKSAVYTFSNFQKFSNPDNVSQSYNIRFFSNPYDGFDYSGITDFRISIQYFADDQMQQPINFIKGSAFIGFASLNNYDGKHIEFARAINGTPISLAGSTVTAHSDGWLYADNDNLNGNISWMDPQTGKVTNNAWDNISAGTYVGAGMAEVSGNNLDVEFRSTEIRPNTGLYVWSLLNTDIPATVYTDPQAYTINEVIHYQYADGKQVQPDYTKTLTYHRTGYKGVNGHITYDQFVPQNFPSVDSPKIDGYTADQTTVAEIPNIMPKVENGNVVKTPDYVRTVIYRQTQQAQVIYRDVNNSNNPTILDQDSLTGIAGEPIVDSNVNTKVTNFENRGYVLKNNGFSTDTAYDNDASKTQTFYIDFVHGTQPITPTTPGTPGQPINPNDPNSPNTQTVLIKTV